MKLPTEPEEYTEFVLANRFERALFDAAEERTGPYTTNQLLDWVEHTVTHYPDLVDIGTNSNDNTSHDGYPVLVNVSIAGILVGVVYNWETGFKECIDLLIKRNQLTLNVHD